VPTQPDASDRPPVGPGAGALSGRTFVIDPGHGLQDSGARAFGVNEKDLVLPYAALLGKKLQAMGAHVVYTRPIDRDGFATWDERTQISNRAHPDAVIRIHANDNDGPSRGANGLETYWMDPKDRALAAAIHGSVLQAERGAVQDRGVHQKNFHVHPNAPSALIELGYMNNRAELNKLMSPAYRNAAVDGMVNGLVRYVQSRG
jgi:N-acetylmuramoyl-L-alanine amidase